MKMKGKITYLNLYTYDQLVFLRLACFIPNSMQQIFEVKS